MLLKREVKSRKKLQKVKILLEKNVYTPIGDLETFAWVTKEPVSFKDRKSGEYLPLSEGQKWGDLFDCAWFNFKFKIPEKLQNSDLFALIDVSGEGLIVDKKGNPLRGMTSVTSRDEWPLGMWGKFSYQISKELINKGYVDIWMDAGCNDIEGQYRNDGRLKTAKVALLNNNIRTLFYDFTSLLSLYDALLEEECKEYKTVLKVLEDAAEQIQVLNEENAQKAIEKLSVLFQGKKNENEFTYSSIGHAHIDLIFLWPLRETIRKGARTYSTVMDLMEKYEGRYNYLFGCSQPQMYELVRENYPILFEKIRKRINEGRWECQGVMWVESDTNIPSGESLIRQILYGKRYFKEMFNKDIEVCFLPDVFGYSAVLPQLLIKSGTKYFMTQKLNMNDTNVFPHHTFMWEGMDGSRVLTHMMPESTYNSQVVPQIVMYGKRNFKNKDVSNEAIQLFGIGDGGGGPGPEHLERLIRNDKISYTPIIKPEFTQDFFRRIEKKKENYPVWKGELYFEKHQGTYTSQAKSKFYNRKVEVLLHECEFAFALSNILCGDDKLFTSDLLEKFWKEILLYQFHDVLPGSSIKRVYEETHSRYKAILDNLSILKDEAYLKIASKIDTAGMVNPVIVFNSLSFDRNEIITSGNYRYKVCVPALGYKVFDLKSVEEHDKNKSMAAKDNVLENQIIKLTFENDGSIKSIYDKKFNREILKGRANRLSVYYDENNNWDIDKRYLSLEAEYPDLISMTEFNNFLESGFEMCYKYLDSFICQKISIQNDSARIDFKTSVSWNETFKMLRTSFPVDFITDHAKCEIQFGYITRPTHRNTSWDEAKFEICAHKWVDIGDNGYGCALLNDSKYGYKVWNNTLDLNLLRSQMCPEVDSDKGEHEFTYSFYPHAGSIEEGGVIREGYKLNYPVYSYELSNHAGILKDEYSMIKINNPSIIVETIKPSEDNLGIIARLYESTGKKCSCNPVFNKCTPLKLTDLTESKDIDEVSQNPTLEFTPFEIKTLYIKSK